MPLISAQSVQKNWAKNTKKVQIQVYMSNKYFRKFRKQFSLLKVFESSNQKVKNQNSICTNVTVHHDWIIDSMTIKKKEYENLKQRFQKTLFTYSYLRNIKNIFDDLDDEEFDEEEYEV